VVNDPKSHGCISGRHYYALKYIQWN
jgi:hypothetical protein